MTPTPRTDAVMHDPMRDGNDLCNLARTLELEIVELNERLIDRQETLMETLIENQNLRRILLMPTNLAIACSRCGSEPITTN